MEGAYAQDEILMFIDVRFIRPKKKYARTPCNLANAMAGLPFVHNVPFMGAWQSYVRCSKLPCPPQHWFQVFDTLQRIWKKSQSSALSTAEFFYQKINALPKTTAVKATDPFTNEQSRNKEQNLVRSEFLDKWPVWELAIKKSLGSEVEPDRIPFLICANFTVLLQDPKTATTLVLDAKP
jgi:hypothetical protein